MAERFAPLTPRIGARTQMRRDEVLESKFADECLDALERYGVLLFAQIGLSDDEQVALAENLGEIIPLGGTRPDGSQDPMFKVSLDPAENPSSSVYLTATIGWHVDGLHDPGPPPKATLLSARRLAPRGGQTEFCSTYVAYDDLSEADRKYCESLRVVHSLVASKRYVEPLARAEELARWRSHRGETEHPLVWQHQSGRKSLILGMTMDHVVGLPGAESQAWIDRLMSTATRRENVYRHEWQLGDLVIWDNCGMLHRAVQYDADSGRLMHRLTLRGVEPIRGVPSAS